MDEETKPYEAPRQEERAQTETAEQPIESTAELVEHDEDQADSARVEAEMAGEDPDLLFLEQHMDRHDVMAAAEAAHEASRAYCQDIGDDSQPPWSEAPNWQKASVVRGVLFILENPGVRPENSHSSWLAEKERAGWIYGPVKNPELKTHPCMVPYDQLPEQQRRKDEIFIANVLGALGLARGDGEEREPGEPNPGYQRQPDDPAPCTASRRALAVPCIHVAGLRDLMALAWAMYQEVMPEGNVRDLNELREPFRAQLLGQVAAAVTVEGKGPAEVYREWSDQPGVDFTALADSEQRWWAALAATVRAVRRFDDWQVQMSDDLTQLPRLGSERQALLNLAGVFTFNDLVEAADDEEQRSQLLGLPDVTADKLDAWALKAREYIAHEVQG